MSISNDLKYNSYEYDKYDKYDIIDFLEQEYIKDWLSIIPNSVWIKNKKVIENRLCNLTDKIVISYLIDKIKLDLPKFIVNNFEKINLELLKFSVENNFDKLKDEIKKMNHKYKDIIRMCITDFDVNFNKYFYETIYFKLEPTHKNKPNTLMNLLGFLPNANDDNFVHKDNMFYVFLKNMENNGCSINNYQVIKYYNEKFKDIFIGVNSKHIRFVNIFNKSKINNYNDTIELKKILNISDSVFKKNILYYADGQNYYMHFSTLHNICLLGDIDFVLQILNFCGDDMIKQRNFIVTVLTFVSLSDKIENVFLIYNYLLCEKNVKFTKDMYSDIISGIIRYSDGKFYKHKKIIFEFINLGGVVSGYSMYTDYINKIKILPIKHD
jgi:hypothetical protein